MHVRELPNGNLEVRRSDNIEVVDVLQVGVHIADVSHFIRHGTAIDDEALKRGTTVYLANKR